MGDAENDQPLLYKLYVFVRNKPKHSKQGTTKRYPLQNVLNLKKQMSAIDFRNHFLSQPNQVKGA